MNLNDVKKLYDFTGRSVIITGGTGILGRTMVEALLGCGASITIITRNFKKGQDLIDTLDESERAFAVQCDVLSLDELEGGRQAVIEKFGRIDCLVNAAGGNRPEATTSNERSFFDIPPDALRQVFDLNLLGTFLPCQVFGKEMAKRGEGVILNISSVSSVLPLTRVVGYSAAKAAINNFTAWLSVHLAREYSPRIRVNALEPTHTPGTLRRTRRSGWRHIVVAFSGFVICHRRRNSGRWRIHCVRWSLARNELYYHKGSNRKGQPQPGVIDFGATSDRRRGVTGCGARRTRAGNHSR